MKYILIVPEIWSYNSNSKELRSTTFWKLESKDQENEDRLRA